MTTDTSQSTEEQEARSKLRETFLKTVAELNGQHCTVTHYEKSSLKAEFLGTDSDIKEFLVKDLQTPIALYKSALLRATDVISIEFD